MQENDILSQVQIEEIYTQSPVTYDEEFMRWVRDIDEDATLARERNERGMLATGPGVGPDTTGLEFPF